MLLKENNQTKQQTSKEYLISGMGNATGTGNLPAGLWVPVCWLIYITFCYTGTLYLQQSAPSPCAGVPRHKYFVQDSSNNHYCISDSHTAVTGS